MNSELYQLVDSLGEDRAFQILSREARRSERLDVLTIVANARVHHLPDELLRGHVYIASEGNLDFSSKESVLREYESILEKLASVVKSRRWRRVYLVPFGPTTLSMQIKMLVYRVTAQETVDWFYDGRGDYFELSFAQREIIARAS